MQKRGNWKRIVSVFIVVAMLAVGIPENAFAEETTTYNVSGGDISSGNFYSDVSDGNDEGDISTGDDNEDVSGGNSSDEKPELIVSDEYNGVYWQIDTNGHLYAKGSGDVVYDYYYVNDFDQECHMFIPLWENYMDKILTADIDVTGSRNAYGMFRGCANLKSADLTHFDMSDIERVDCMFQDCISLEEVRFGECKININDLYNGLYRRISY